VRNATMGNAQGVVTITLTFPLDIDPSKVRDIHTLRITHGGVTHVLRDELRVRHDNGGFIT
jgi:hypothetical protein